MSATLEAGPNLEMETWNRLRIRAIFEHCKWDPQSEDRSVLARYPLFLNCDAFRQLQEHAESLSREALTAEKEILNKAELWEELGIPRKIRRALLANESVCETDHVRVMRFDFHNTREGWKISEVNADVPGGYIEGSGWNALFAEHCNGESAPPSPSQLLAMAIRASVPGGSAVALVHATTFSDDRQVMMKLAKELHRGGLKPILAGPENIVWKDCVAYLKNGSERIEVSAAIRFFPAEWFPQLPRTNDWGRWFSGSKTILCNPGRAILLQSKRLPLIWQELNSPLDTWRQLLPETVDPTHIRHSEGDEWVIKPAFGRVGEDVAMKNVMSNADYGKLLREAGKHPQKWIAQKRFETLPVRAEEGNVYPCMGVFTVEGKFAGIYGRAGRTPLINQEAQDVAVLVRAETTRGPQ